jgi:sec-independent protein translocase protein TatA
VTVFVDDSPHSTAARAESASQRAKRAKKGTMMGLHWPDLALVTAVAFLILGPRRLPEMGSAVGKTLREFKRSMSELSEAARSEIAPDRSVAVTEIAAPLPAPIDKV